MEYLAHTNDKGEKQLIKEHLEKTALLCGKFADSFGIYEWGYCCGLLHDLGKYSLKFQERIQNNGPTVDHSTAAAKLCWDKKGYYHFLSYCIAGHHTGLLDTGSKTDTNISGTMMGRVKKKIEDSKAWALNDTSAAPLDCAPCTPLIGAWILAISSFFPVTRQTPAFSPSS